MKLFSKVTVERRLLMWESPPNTNYVFFRRPFNKFCVFPLILWRTLWNSFLRTIKEIEFLASICQNLWNFLYPKFYNDDWFLEIRNLRLSAILWRNLRLFSCFNEIGFIFRKRITELFFSRRPFIKIFFTSKILDWWLIF